MILVLEYSEHRTINAFYLPWFDGETRAEPESWPAQTDPLAHVSRRHPNATYDQRRI